MTDAFSSLHLSACNYRWNPLPPTSWVRKLSLCTLSTAPQMVWVHLPRRLSVDSVPTASKSNVRQLLSRFLMDKAMDTQWKIPEPDHHTKLHSTAALLQTWTSSYVLWVGNPSSVWEHWVDVPLYTNFLWAETCWIIWSPVTYMFTVYVFLYSLFSFNTALFTPSLMLASKNYIRPVDFT